MLPVLRSFVLIIEKVSLYSNNRFMNLLSAGLERYFSSGASDAVPSAGLSLFNWKFRQKSEGASPEALRSRSKVTKPATIVPALCSLSGFRRRHRHQNFLPLVLWKRKDDGIMRATVRTSKLHLKSENNRKLHLYNRVRDYT